MLMFWLGIFFILLLGNIYIWIDKRIISSVNKENKRLKEAHEKRLWKQRKDDTFVKELGTSLGYQLVGQAHTDCKYRTFYTALKD